jgi:CheY-like chemotaxis protein
MRVLLVDDNVHVRNVLRYGLTKVNGMQALNGRSVTLQIEEACDGHQALRLLEANDYDLLVIDYYMPVMTGAQIIERLRRDPRTAHLPVIMVSASGDEAVNVCESTTNALAVAKPLRAVDLKKAVARICRLEDAQDSQRILV